ncbi:MAG: serine/threonine-protein kinase, partial [Verrucomicrobiales bacterium]
ARDRELDRTVAIKILPPEVGCDAEFQERFRQEATTLANLNHPNIVTLQGAGEREGYFFFVMEFIEGTDLSHLLLRELQLPVERSVDIASQLCDALEYSHEQGVVHRDIKPANILLDEAGRVKVADFGLAKILQVEEQFLPALTRTRSSMGTVQYMAPEQAAGATQLDHRVDVYAIGAVVYEMLTGVVPAGAFDRPSEKVPGLNRSYDDVILRALSSEPERRFQSVAEVRSALIGASTSRKYFRQRWLRRASMAALVCLSVGAGVAGYAWLNQDEPVPAETVSPPVAEVPPEPLKPLISTDGVASLIDRIRAPAKTMVPLAGLPTPDEPATLVGYGPGIPQVDGDVALAFAISRDPGRFSASISPDGALVVWGEMRVPEGSIETTAIAAGARHLVVLHRDGRVSTLGAAEPGTETSGVVAVDASIGASWAL